MCVCMFSDRSSNINFSFISAPPQSVEISDDVGSIKNEITSAYAEGASITLMCSASGGRPMPKVSWKRNGESVINETQYFPERQKSLSVLRIDKLVRSHLLVLYSCEVSNSVQSPPLIVRVSIDMYLRPLEVKLLGQNEPLSAGKRIDMICRCKGSRPAATISWWKVSSHSHFTQT